MSDEPATKPQADEPIEQIRTIVERARHGDTSVLPALRQLLDGIPDLWREYGDLAKKVEQLEVDQLAGANLHFQEALSRKLAELRNSLCEPGSRPLVNLLAQRVVATYLNLQVADLALLKFDELPFRVAKLRLERQRIAHRQHLASVKLLFAVKHLSDTTPGGASIAVTPPPRELPASTQVPVCPPPTGPQRNGKAPTVSPSPVAVLAQRNGHHSRFTESMMANGADDELAGALWSPDSKVALTGEVGEPCESRRWSD